VITNSERQTGVVGNETDRIDSSSNLKRFVTFYITQFPPQATLFFLRKGFEVCGILEDVFVANNRNKNGEVYVFVHFANVQDVDKLLKALNNVRFGQYRVCAVLARFDRKRERKGVKMREGEGVGGKRGGESGGEVVKVREKEGEGEKSKDGLEGKKKEEVGEGGVGDGEGGRPEEEGRIW
jgi:hypothetical protein